MTFEQWCDEIDRVAIAKYGFKVALTLDSGREHWRDSYESGLAPEEALLDDMENWE